MPTDKLLELEGLTKYFYKPMGLLGRRKQVVQSVDHVSLHILRHETFGLVGESGCGKSTLGRTITRLYEPTEGKILYDGTDISHLTGPQLLPYRKRIQMIFQDPQASLNERAKVDYIISEGLMNIEKGIGEKERKKRVDQALLDVGLLPEFASRFPHEFSGGQRQRIGIARALIMNPEFIIADEPISALDVSVRAQVLNLLADMQKKRGITYLFIAHDLSVMRFITDRIAVIRKGEIVEMAETEELITHAIHPYTRALLSAIPMPDPRHEREKKLLVYDASMHHYETDPPSWREVRPEHYVLANSSEYEAYKKLYRDR